MPSRASRHSIAISHCALQFALVVTLSAQTHEPGADVALLADLVQGERYFDPYGSSPANFTRLGNNAYFKAAGELWMTDGTPARTRCLAELCGACAAADIVDTNDERILLRGPDSQGVVSLWRLTADGDADRFAMPEGVLLQEDTTFAAFDRGAVLRGFSPTYGTELYFADEHDLTITLIDDLVPGHPSSLAGRLISSEDLVYFVARKDHGDPDYDARALYATDGTAAGTLSLVRGDGPFPPVLDGRGRAYFVVEGPAALELWSSDGSPAGTLLIAAIPPYKPQGFGSSAVAGIIGLDEGIATVVWDPEHQYEIWTASAGSGTLRRVTDLKWQPSGIEVLGEIGESLLFNATDEVGNPRVWSVARDGGAPQRLAFGVATQSFIMGDHLVFARADSRREVDTSVAEVWTSDGTSEGTARLGEGRVGQPCAFTIAEELSPGGLLYFFSCHGNRSGADLWSTDGTDAGTVLVARATELDQFDLQPPLAIEVPGFVVFRAADDHGREPWTAPRGRPQDARILVDLASQAMGSRPDTFFDLPGKPTSLVYSCEPHGQLWETDGTRLSTKPFAPATSEQYRLRCGTRPPELTSLGNAVFIVDDAFPENLLRIDPSTNTIETVFTSTGGLSRELRVVGEKLVFFHRPQSTSPSSTLEIRTVPSANSDSTPLIAEIPGLYVGSTATDHELFVLAAVDREHLQLWRSDLTAEGTKLLRDFPDSSASSNTLVLTIGDTLYFSGSYRTAANAVERGIFQIPLAVGPVRFPRRGTELPSGTEPLIRSDAIYVASYHGGGLLRLDGSSIEQLVELPTSRSTDRTPLAAIGNTFYFLMLYQDASELWASDGTKAGTHRIFALPYPSRSTEIEAHDGYLFLALEDPAHGNELWISDGTESGTRLLRDIFPGARSSFPHRLASTSNGLFLAADDGLHGREPWVISLGSDCRGSDYQLCLKANRFRVEMMWRNPDRSLHDALTQRLTPDTGAFWFFGAKNLENIVKMIDGRKLNDAFWLFSGGLSNLEYYMTVTDVMTGSARRYFNPPSNLASYGDTRAFPHQRRDGASLIDVSNLASRTERPRPANAVRWQSATQTDCLASETVLCLNGGRFAVAVSFTDFLGTQGLGHTRPVSDGTGAFWFFDENNLELVVKVLDGTSVNGRHWVFFASLSNVQFTVRVTDTENGTLKEYRNPGGIFASLADTNAF